MMRQLLKRVLGIAELLMASSLKNPFHLLPVLAEFNYKKRINRLQNEESFLVEKSKPHGAVNRWPVSGSLT